MKPTVQIVSITEEYADRLREAVDSVARERRYLASVEGFSLDETLDLVRNILNGGGVQLVALANEQVVGWCDILRLRFEGFEHVGALGMGVIASHRAQGIGKHLLKSSIEAAVKIGITKIELEVFASNKPAVHLYSTMGFVTEGVKKSSRKLDGKTDDIVCMAYFAGESAPA
jgi:ribosomal protein S18 acetylase RimI-like enzyme